VTRKVLMIDRCAGYSAAVFIETHNRLLRGADYDRVATEVQVVIVHRRIDDSAVAPAPSRIRAANSPPLILSSSSPGSSFGFGVPAEGSLASGNLLDRIANAQLRNARVGRQDVMPLTTLTVNEVAWLPSTTTMPSLVVKLTEVPATVETCAGTVVEQAVDALLGKAELHAGAGQQFNAAQLAQVHCCNALLCGSNYAFRKDRSA
jgi:hypothetical protein